MTKVQFSYNVKMDADNFIRAHHSLNRTDDSKLYSAFVREHPDTVPTVDTLQDFIKDYIAIEKIDIEAGLQASREYWYPVQAAYFQRVENIFKVSLPTEIITAYASINDRHGYNIDEGYFFISADRPEKNNFTIAHEIFHFYTWYQFAEPLKAEGLTLLQYNDIKESLTEILNIEFADLLNGRHDNGYPQHQEMRHRINELQKKGKSLEDIVSDLVRDIKKGDAIGTPLESRKKELFP
jgi:hypothetical protein